MFAQQENLPSSKASEFMIVLFRLRKVMIIRRGREEYLRERAGHKERGNIECQPEGQTMSNNVDRK